MQLVDDDAADSSVKVNLGGHQHCTVGTEKILKLHLNYCLFVYVDNFLEGQTIGCS